MTEGLKRVTTKIEKIEYNDVKVFFEAIGEFLSTLEGLVNGLCASHTGYANHDDIEFQEAHAGTPTGWFLRIDDLTQDLLNRVKALEKKKK